MVAMLPIAAMLGKADTAFKAVGGSSIIFNLIKHRIFGKNIRCIEYPDGDLQSFQIYRMNVGRLREVIADAQPPPFPTAFLHPEDVKQISVWTSPHFTEAIKTDADVRAIADGGWLFWSKDGADEEPIPRRGVKLDGSHIPSKSKDEPTLSPSDLISDRTLQDTAIRLSRSLLIPPSVAASPSSSSVSSASTSTPSASASAADAPPTAAGGGDGARVSPLSRSFAVLPVRGVRRRPPPPSLTQWQYDRLVDLAVDGDAGLLTLARNFGDDRRAFRRAALRLLSRRDPSAILLSATPGEVAAAVRGGDSADGDGAGTASPTAGVEPQVELASRG